jgi:hypothetical protein
MLMLLISGRELEDHEQEQEHEQDKAARYAAGVPRLKPILLRLFAAALIGAAVTVGVAAVCAMSPPWGQVSRPGPHQWVEPETGHSYILARDIRTWGSRRSLVLAWPDGAKVSSRVPELEGGRPFPTQALPLPSLTNVRNLRSAGWPCMCVWGGIDGVPPSAAGPPQSFAAVGAMPIGRPLDEFDEHGVCGYLPITPIWSGLAIDTLFYGTIAWGLVFLPGDLRHWRRSRGGRCVKCGYDRAGLAPEAACPECGSSPRPPSLRILRVLPETQTNAEEAKAAKGRGEGQGAACPERGGKGRGEE